MASRFVPLSASENPLVRGIRRAGVSRANRRLLIFLAPFLLVGAGYLSTDSANNPDSGYQLLGQNNDAGVVLHAVAIPRYIPQDQPNYQETEVPAPDLTVAKANDAGGNATVGNLFNWTLTVANGGTSDATFTDGQTILWDPLPAGPEYGSSTPANFTNITNSEYINCSIVSDELICEASGGDVIIGAGGSFTVSFSAIPAAAGSLDNTATVDPDNFVAESNEGNNGGSDSVTVTSPGPDLTVAKANDAGGNATVGNPFNWTLTVANGGASDATFTNGQTILWDPLPAGPEYGSSTPANFTNITNSEYINCSIVSDELICEASGGDVIIGAGGSFTVSFSAIPAAAGSLDNTATVDPDNFVAQSNEGNNGGSDSVTVTSPGPDLTVAKANDAGGNATVGNPFNWTLTVANGGTSDGTFTDGQTILRDTLPTGPTYGSPAAGNFTGITNSEFISCSIDTDVLSCTAVGGDVTIGAGGSFTVTFSATPATTDSLNNTATVDPDSSVAESNEGNNTGSDTVTVTFVGPDLTIAKANDTGGNATVGNPFNWTLTVANGGTSDGTFTDGQTILRDTLPTGPTYGSPAAGNFTGFTNSEFISCSIDTDVLSCTAVGGDVTIGAGGSFTVTFSATPATTDSLNNTATVDPDSSVAESNEGNNTGSDMVTVTFVGPDLTIAKANDTGGNATVGNPFNWTLMVANNGTGGALFADTQTILLDYLPAGPAYGLPTAGNFTNITNSENIICSIVGVELTCTVEGAEVTIGVGGGFTVTFSVTPAEAGSLDNTATVDPDSSVAESNEGNNTGSDTVPVESAPGAPINDNFANAIAATPLPFTSNILTVDASSHGNDPVLSCISGGPSKGSKSVWYSYSTTEYEAITIDATGSDYATAVAVWRGTWPNGLSEVACSENAPVTVALLPGTTYYLEVVQSGGNTGGELLLNVDSALFHGLRADYFDNPDLSGTPLLTRVDPFIDFDWTFLPPAPNVPNQDISVRWTGRILAQYSETYTFYTYSDDGVRLYVDDQLLIDHWESTGLELNTATIALQAGTYYSIRLEYFQTSGSSVVELLWSSASLPEETVPTNALDYLDVVNSTVIGDGARPLANGVATSTIRVTLYDTLGHAVSGVPVYLKVSGSGNYINNSAVGSNIWVLIGYSDTNGEVVGLLASTSVGDKTVDAMADGVRVGSSVVVTFVAGEVQRISVSHITGREGEEADSHSYFPSVSNDGTRVMFLSWATNLLPDDDTGNPNIFILNTETNLLSPAIFATENGQPNDLISDPSISGNGQFVVFTSVASNLSASCTDGGASDIFLYQIVEGGPGTFTCISVGSGGAEGNAASEHPAISDDGRYIVFASSATNLVDGVAGKQIYLYDRNTSTMSVVSRNSAEELANDDSDNPSISADGMSIVFESRATNLLGAGEDTNGFSDIFLRDRSGDETTIRVSVAHTAGLEPDEASILPSISSDGTRVAFISNAGNLVSGASGVKNVFLRTIPSASTSLVSVAILGGGANGNSDFARISSDGLHVIFESTASNLAAGSYGGEQIYLRDFENSETVKISKSAGGVEGDNSSLKGGISGDGTTIVFESIATNLLGEGIDNNNASDIFLIERVAPPVPPSNDAFDEAISFTAPSYYNTESTLLATRDILNDPSISCGGPSQHYNSVWYTIQPSVNTRLDLSTAGSDYDTVLAVWTGTPGSLTEVACNDDAAGVQSGLDFLALSGTRYWIEVVQKGAPGGGSLVFRAVEVVPDPVFVYVFDTHGTPDVGMTVTAFIDDDETIYSAVTNSSGEAMLTLPEGHYRFRVIKSGTVFWSGADNHCVIPGGCSDPDPEIVTIGPVIVTVEDTSHAPELGMEVRAYDGSGYTGVSGVTDSSGQVSLTLPVGVYHFRVVKNGTVFWSAPTPDCSLPACSSDGVTTNVPVVVHVVNGAGSPEANVWVSVYDDDLFTGLSFKTDSNGDARFTLPDGDYRFRVDKLDRGYWSDTGNHCFMPTNCPNFTMTIYTAVVVHVEDANGNNEVGLPVSAFLGASSDALAFTDTNGDATLQLPDGDHRFRVMKGGTAFWSGETPDTPTCSVPTCTSDSVTTNIPVVVHVVNGAGLPEANVWVSAYDFNSFTGLSFKTDASGDARFILPDGDYRFRVDKLDRGYWSDTGNHCFLPTSCPNFTMTIDTAVVVHVEDVNGNDEVGLPVSAFLGASSNALAFTDANGNATLQLPNGDHRFRVMKGGTAFWSGETPDTPTCSIPTCSGDSVTTNVRVLVTILNGSSQPVANVWVHAFNNELYTGLSVKTNAQGNASFVLPDGQYRFRADTPTRVFWSGPSNHLTVPSATLNVSFSIGTTVVVHVHDTNGNNDTGLPVRAFLGASSIALAFTDANGDAAFQLPNDSYQFRVTKGGTNFWSGPAGHCNVPSCSGATVVTNVPVVVHVVNGAGVAEANLWVSAYDFNSFTGLSFKTDVNGDARFTLPDGNYRFRVDKLDRGYWSDTGNHCFLPTSCPDFTMTTGNLVVVHVQDVNGINEVGLPVRAFLGASSIALAFTDTNGNATLQVPNGEYRFRAMKGGTAFWSGPAGHCVVPACSGATVVTNVPVVVTVLNGSGLPEADLWVHAFSEDLYAGLSIKTDAEGHASFTLPDGEYRFRADKDGFVYWSGPSNHCVVHTNCTPPFITTEGTGYAFVPDDWDSVFSGTPLTELALTERWRSADSLLFFI